MLFNSIDFAVFLPVVFFLYWFVFHKNIRVQNTFLLAASYFFYGCWDWRFLFLIFVSSAVDYSIGMGLSRAEGPMKRNALLAFSLSMNLGLLWFFKYYNFFIDNFAKIFVFMGRPAGSFETLEIVLPVGISFYTFQTLSYTIDVYRKKIEPTSDMAAFFAFVGFFPQLVAGPIERAANLLPQFFSKRRFEYEKAVDGMRQILWGLFKKIVIADNCARVVNDVFANYLDYSGSTLMLGAVFFSFQIYCDFSGYSDIAIGTSRLFGFRLKKNFAFPYFSRDISEFWRRWHISLSTWFRDYVYIPMGGSRCGAWKKVRNVFIVFLISGFWHGANWTFIAWGGVHALVFLPLLLANKNRIHLGPAALNRLLPGVKETLQIGTTFFITVLAWIFFRAETLDQARGYLMGMVRPSFFSYPQVAFEKTFCLVAVFIVVEWFQRGKNHGLELDGFFLPRWVRWGVYYGIILLCMTFGGSAQEFIYFQF